MRWQDAGASDPLVSCLGPSGMFGPSPPPSPTIPIWATNGSPDTQVSPEMKKLIYLPKLAPLCPLMRFKALSPQLLPKSVIPNTAIGDVTSPTPIWTSKSPKSLRRNFFFLAPYAVSSPVFTAMARVFGIGHSLLLSSYLHRISRKENSDCSACGHPLQDLNHLLDCPTSGPLRGSIFGSSLSILDLLSGPWGVAQLLDLRGVPPCPHSSEGVG